MVGQSGVRSRSTRLRPWRRRGWPETESTPVEWAPGCVGLEWGGCLRSTRSFPWHKRLPPPVAPNGSCDVDAQPCIQVARRRRVCRAPATMDVPLSITSATPISWPARRYRASMAGPARAISVGRMRLALCWLLSLACVGLAAGCTGGSHPTDAAVTVKAPKACPPQTFDLHNVTPVAAAEVASVVRGHLPTRLPTGFGLQEVDRVDDAGYAAWTDAQCRRIALFFDPSQSSIGGPAVHAFGPWMKLQRCGEPRPCVVYQGGVTGGLLTFSTWQLEPRTAATVLRSVRLDG